MSRTDFDALSLTTIARLAALADTLDRATRGDTMAQASIGLARELAATDEIHDATARACTLSEALAFVQRCGC